MKLRALLMILAFTIVLLAASDARSASVGVYFDAAGSQSTIQPPPFSPFDVFLVARGIDSIQAFELSVEFTDPGLLVLSRDVYNSPCVICPPGDEHNYIRSLSRCVQDFGDKYTFLKYSLGYFSGATLPEDMTICVRPSEPTQLNMPAYYDCQDQLLPLDYSQWDSCGAYGDGCAVIHPSVDLEHCVVATEQTSFGTMKSRW